MSLLGTLRSWFNAARQTQSYWPNRGTRIVYVQSTLAGIRVTPDTALQQATVWACVQVLSKSIAQLPWRLMRHTSPATSVACPGTLDDLLNHRPNPEMSAFTFRETLIGHVLTWGNAFAEIQRDQAGRPIALWPIEPDRVWPKRWWENGDPGELAVAGEPAWAVPGRLYYQVTNQTKGISKLDFMDVLHLHGPSFDGVTGYQVVGYAAQSIGLAMAIDRFGAASFGNNCQLGGTIENAKTNLSAEGREAMLASFNEKHQGPDRSFKWQYLDGGMKAVPMPVNMEQAQLVQAQQQTVEQICRWFGVPPHKVAHLLRATNNNIEHQGIEFVTDGVLPWTTRLEQEANFKLINARNPQGYYSRIDVRSLQRGDLAARSAFYQAMFDRGIMSVNDIREAEGQNEIPEEEGGNKRFVPLNMQLLEDAGAADPDDAAAPSPDAGGDAQPGGGSQVPDEGGSAPAQGG